jgi:3-hydroxyacyl-[acyl-carrier-protein] dehydratase
MHFSLVDRVLESTPERLIAIKHVSNAEEYLLDHFPGFPVLPGVMMLEAMVQASRLLHSQTTSFGALPLVLGRVRALKYGRFCKPGSTLRIETSPGKSAPDEYDFHCEIRIIEPESATLPVEQLPIAASGRITLRPARVPSLTA